MWTLSHIFARLHRRPKINKRVPFCFPTFPTLRPTQVAAVCVETRTGIPLNVEGQRHRACGGEVYRVFDTIVDARGFAERAVDENQEAECVMFDHLERVVETIQPRWVRELAG